MQLLQQWNSLRTTLTSTQVAYRITVCGVLSSCAAPPGGLNHSFPAGVGSVLTASGGHELEASVMTSKGRCGAVAVVKHVANPVRLAQQVRTNRS